MTTKEEGVAGRDERVALKDDEARSGRVPESPTCSNELERERGGRERQ